MKNSHFEESIFEFFIQSLNNSITRFEKNQGLLLEEKNLLSVAKKQAEELYQNSKKDKIHLIRCIYSIKKEMSFIKLRTGNPITYFFHGPTLGEVHNTFKKIIITTENRLNIKAPIKTSSVNKQNNIFITYNVTNFNNVRGNNNILSNGDNVKNNTGTQKTNKIF